eukprot:c15881_g2_i1 orf=260-871(-)
MDAFLGQVPSQVVYCRGFKVSVHLKDAETSVIKENLGKIPDWFPTNINIGDNDVLGEWEWEQGIKLEKVSVKVVYAGLVHNQDWSHSLNCRWKRTASESWWSRRCFKVWKGTPFAMLNLWNWGIMTGALMTGDKLRHWEKISGLCPWCKASRETIALICFGACPAIRSFWLYQNYCTYGAAWYSQKPLYVFQFLLAIVQSCCN